MMAKQSLKKGVLSVFFVAWLALFMGRGQAIEQEQGEGESSDRMGGIIYSPSGKRDPFQPPLLNPKVRSPASVSELEKFSLGQLQLRGILRDEKKPRAMFEDPEGKTHIVKEGDIVGRERATASRILDTEVIMTLRTFNYLGAEKIYEKIISLPQK